MSITVDELEQLCSKVSEQRLVVAEIEACKKSANEELDRLENKVLEVFKALDKKSYNSKAGNFVVSHRLSVKLPATPEDREQFFAYLKERGMYDTSISVHSATLNRIYKDEFAAAKERGDFDFEIPGIGAPTVAEILSVKKS